ncbi:MAG TPA: DHHA1 domain-containing protein [Candidatus Nanoarchaeia archaeon]|nr:DHHA1 domain-containing protein [Candidatus Nanoarchaeia archaeon]
MLTNIQIREIREHLNRAQNPLFLFDNDTDGLCAFLILQRFAGKGKGFPIKSFPELNSEYLRKVSELNSDYIFMLDKPEVSDEFVNEIMQLNIPIVWIDHHEVKKKPNDFVNYYNPIFNENKSNAPTTYLCYQVSRRKEDLWLAVVGSISDRFYPEFYEKFQEEYPDLSISSTEPFEIYYKSQIGKVAKLFSFALKDRTTNVINMIKFLMKVKSPYEVLEQTKENYTMHKRFKQIDFKYQKLLEKAKRLHNGKILFFSYGGDLSISSDLSNELNHFFPDKTIVVAYVSGTKINISVRGKKIRNLFLKAIENLDASGGGHEDAIGIQLKSRDFEKFKNNLKDMMNEES